MVLRYYSDFKSFNGSNYRLEIHTKNATSSEELILSADGPVSCSYSSDELCAPLKLSGLTINGLTSEILLDLHTGENLGVEVLLYKDSNLVWCGWMTPNIYDASYVTPIDTISLEAIDSLSTLDNIAYTYQGDYPNYVSFLSILLDSIERGDPSGRIQHLYIHNTLKLTETSTDKILEILHINEYNFYDEVDDAMKYKEVLEEICNFLGMTMILWNGSIYMFDYEFLSNGYNTFTMYDRQGNSGTSTMDLTPITTKLAIVKGNSCSIGVGDVYSKVSVVANTNPIGDVLPELFDDLVNQNEDENKYYTEEIGANTYLYAFFFSYTTNNTAGAWEALKPTYSYWDENMNWITAEIPEINNITKNRAESGTWFNKADSYVTSDVAEKSSIDWTNYITFVYQRGLLNYGEEPHLLNFLSLKKDVQMVLRGGYFVVAMNFMLSTNPIPSYSDDYFSSTHNGDGKIKFPCRIKIGDYYYNGEEWLLYQSYLDKVSAGYYDFSTTISEDDNGNHFWKTPGDFIGVGPDSVEITEEEYNELNLKDRFWLIHSYVKGDTMLSWSTIDNQVSYKMNLSTSTEGALIPMPTNKLLSGRVEFTLEAPDSLGIFMVGHNGTNVFACYCHIKELSLTYSTANDKYNIFTTESSDTDIVYSNVIDSNNVTEADDLELKINTVSDNANSYSSVVTKIADVYNYLDTLYSPLEGGAYRPESILVNKRCNHYGTVKIKYSNELGFSITPFSILQTEVKDKEMVIDYLELDYAQDKISVNAVEV